MTGLSSVKDFKITRHFMFIGARQGGVPIGTNSIVGFITVFLVTESRVSVHFLHVSASHFSTGTDKYFWVLDVNGFKTTRHSMSRGASQGSDPFGTIISIDFMTFLSTQVVLVTLKIII